MKTASVIRPKSRFFELNIKEIWQYRDLVIMFVKRDIVTLYKQTVLGPFWNVVQPAITVIMYMLVFGGIAGIPTEGIPQPLFYLSGVCMWQYFSDCLTKTSNTFATNAGLFNKVYFPRLICPLSALFSNLFRFCIQFFLFVAVYLFYEFRGTDLYPNWYILLMPLLVLMLGGIAFGIGNIISTISIKYRDMQVLFTFIVQIWMYATPIVYPLTEVNGTFLGIDLNTLICLNPITPIIRIFRYSCFGVGEFAGWLWIAYSFIFTIVILLVGMIMFNRKERIFMDTV
jgi:lipopolysaccharide transport system permease protein